MKYSILSLLMLLVIEINSLALNSNLLPRINTSNKIGYSDLNGNIKIPCEYDEGGYFKDGFAIVGKNGLYGVIDTTGKIKLPINFCRVKTLTKNHVAGIKKPGIWEIYELPNRYLGSFKDNYCPKFNEDGLLIISNLDSCLVLNLEGKEIVPSGSSNLRIEGKYFFYKYKNFEGVSSHKGIKLAAEYDDIKCFYLDVNSHFRHQVFFLTKKNGKWGLTSKYTVVPNNFNVVKKINDKVYIFIGSKESILVNLFNNYQTASNPHYEYFELSNNFIGFKNKSRKYGLIDIDTLNEIASGFDSLFFTNFKSGFGAGVLHYKKDLIEGIVNSKGEAFKIPKYDSISKIHDSNNYTIYLSNKVGMIDPWGKYLLESKYDRLDIYNWCTFCWINGKCGLYDNYKEKMLIECRYDNINGDILWVDGKCGLYDFYENKLILECIYDSIKRSIDNKIAITFRDNIKKIHYLNEINYQITQIPRYKKDINNWYFYNSDYYISHNSRCLLIKDSSKVNFGAIWYLNKQFTLTLKYKIRNNPFNDMIEKVEGEYYGLYDEIEGKFILPCKYLEIQQVGKLLICYTQEKEFEVRALNGKLIIDHLSYVGIESNNLIRFNKGGKVKPNSFKSKILYDFSPCQIKKYGVSTFEWRKNLFPL